MVFDGELVAFTVLALVLVIAPGVDFAAVVRNAMLDRRGGVLTAVGIVAGLLVHTSVAVVVVATARGVHEGVFTALQLAGAAYLLYLGVTSFVGLARARHAARRTASVPVPVAVGASSDAAPAPRAVDDRLAGELGRSAWGFFRQGFLVNVLNPKATATFLSLLPQFIPPGAQPVAQAALLSLIIVGWAALWFPTLAVLADVAKERFGRARTTTVVTVLTGLLFLAIGLRMAIGGVASVV